MGSVNRLRSGLQHQLKADLHRQTAIKERSVSRHAAFSSAIFYFPSGEVDVEKRA